MEYRNRSEHISLSQLEKLILNPTNYTFTEFKETFGLEAAKTVYASLYKIQKNKINYRQIIPVECKSDKNTIKYVFQLYDKHHIESVVIKRRTGKTLCLSSQVGCPIKCRFCQSGKNGFLRNLTASEIIQQYLFIREDINRIVFMGIGEPLLNYEELLKAIHILRDRNGLDFPTDGITISTVGPSEKIFSLKNEHMKIQLVLSLHATDQKTRDFLIPGMSMYNINEIISLAMEYGRKHKRKVSIAYLLLPGINDREKDVKKLAEWFSHKNVVINLLKYNGKKTRIFKSVEQQELELFKAILEKENIQVTIRQSLGDTIQAACGQLTIK